METSLTIVGARVFDGATSTFVPRTVSIADGRIHTVEEVEPARGADGRDADYGADVFDARGLTMLPGLIDSHTHLTATGTSDLDAQLQLDSPPLAAIRAVEASRMHLRSGTTTVRDCGALNGAVIAAARAIDEGISQGARIQAAGAAITMTGGHGWTSVAKQVDGVSDLRKATRLEIRSGAQCIKVMASGGLLTKGVSATQITFSRDEIAVIVEEAHHAGLRVTAHAIGGQGIKDALAAGVDSIEHGFFLDDEAIELLLAPNVFLVPTLSGVHCALEGQGSGDEIAPWLLEKTKSVEAIRRKSFRRAIEAGVRFAAGTDAGTPFNYHGRVAREVQLLTEYMSPAQALIAATQHGAENLGIFDHVGSIEVGKIADLLLVEGDPLSDISALERVKWVFKDGEVAVTPDGLKPAA